MSTLKRLLAVVEDLRVSDLGVELAKWLVERRSGLLVCDADVTEEVCIALASTMGCLLATVLAQAGEKSYGRAVKRMVARADEAARNTVRAAAAKKANATPRPT